jgi:hypothetical protein
MLCHCPQLLQRATAWIVMHVPPAVAVERRSRKVYVGGAPDAPHYAAHHAVPRGEADKWWLVRTLVAVCGRGL